MLGAATADLRYGPYGFRSRLSYACWKNDKARVQWLLECGARDVSAALEPGFAGAFALVRRLAPHPLVDATQALMAAAWVGVADLVAPLLARGAQIDDDEDLGAVPYTALQAASARGHVKMMRTLLDAGADVDAVGTLHETALMCAAEKGHVEAARVLVAAGADVNRRVRGISAAVLAATEERAPVAAYLCRLPQADPSAHIVAACWLGDAALVRAFIARGADVEETDENFATCLMLAAERGHKKVVRALLREDAQVVDEDNPAWHSALCTGVAHPAIMALLLEHIEVDGDNENEMHQAALIGALYACVRSESPTCVDSMRLLVDAGADVDWVAYDESYCLLSLAAEKGNVAAFQALLDAGADVGGMDREASPRKEVRRHCRKPEAVPALLAALEAAAVGGGGRGRRPQPRGEAAAAGGGGDAAAR
jgi:ankyrin repeat protein